MATTKEQLLKVVKGILVDNGHPFDVEMSTNLTKDWGLSDIEFSIIVFEVYDRYKDVIPEDEVYNYNENRSRVEDIINWVLRWTNK